MDLRNEKGKLWRWTASFFGMMLLFTLLSRAAYQNAVVAVTTEGPRNGTIAHKVNVSGKTVQNQELAVTTVAGLRIAGVYVNEGQQVKQGDVLFALDLDFLQETITFQQQEMKKQELSIQDAWSQNNANYQQRSIAQQQAQENYDAAVSEARKIRDRAKQDLERAEAALEAFYNGATAGQAEEALLNEVCQKAKTDYEAASLALEQLNKDMEAEIHSAIEKACSELPQSRDLEDSEAGTDPTTDMAASDTESTDPETLTQDKLDSIAQEIRDKYTNAMAQAELLVRQTQKAMEDAASALTAFQQEGADTPERSEQELIDAVEKAKEAYDDAAAALKNAKTTYGQAIEAAELPAASNSSAQIGQITYDQMALRLRKLTELQEAEGKILAPIDGIVTGSFVQTGEKTTESTAVRLADMSQGYKFSGLVNEAQSQYIGAGDKVTIRAGSNGKVYKDLPVTTFSATEDAGGGYRITVQLPVGSLSLGVSAELQFTRKSQPYSICVPLSAMRLDERNQPYVLTLEEVNTVLGPQLQAKKVMVTVLDQNETMAALEEGAVSSQHQIIIGSEKPIAPGSRVRVQ